MIIFKIFFKFCRCRSENLTVGNRGAALGIANNFAFSAILNFDCSKFWPCPRVLIERSIGVLGAADFREPLEFQYHWSRLWIGMRMQIRISSLRALMDTPAIIYISTDPDRSHFEAYIIYRYIWSCALVLQAKLPCDIQQSCMN